MVKNVDGCPYFVRRVKVPNSTFPLSLAQYIIQVKETGLLVVQLMDTCGNCCHAVGINVEEKMIYDCQEKNALPLSLNNLSHCCGPNLTFSHFYNMAEIYPNDPKKYKVKFIYDVISN